MHTRIMTENEKRRSFIFRESVSTLPFSYLLHKITNEIYVKRSGSSLALAGSQLVSGLDDALLTSEI